MRRAIEVAPAGSWPEEDTLASVTLPYVDRFRRRVRMTDDAGEPFLLDLERPVLLGDGDGLKLEGGGLIRVKAAEEIVIEAQAASAVDTARLAWHIGNRHTPVQVLADGTLRIVDDPVLADLLARLGARLFYRHAPFSPEPGAYAEQTPEHVRDDRSPDRDEP
jgi:urease accessory protein